MKRVTENRGVPADAAPDAAPELSSFDHATYKDLLEVVGPNRMLTLLDRLAQTLRDDVTAKQAREGLESMAHQLVAAAGALGFWRLADLCRELEDACARGAELAEITLKLNDACAAALVVIETLKTTLHAKT